MPQKKILILTASPDDESKIRADKEITAIKEELNGSKYKEKFTINFELAVKPDKLDSILQTEQPEIVHFCGHGKKEGLVLENDSEKSHVVPLEAFADLISKFKNMECVVLNACYSHSQANKINENVQYVIGMTEQIEDTAAIKFATHFYRALFAGYGYKDSYDFGRIAIGILGIENDLLSVFLQKSPAEPITPTEYQNEPTDNHYNDVIHAFKKGLVIPFLGSGIHLYDGQPTLSDIQLAERLAQNLGIAGLHQNLVGARCSVCLLSADDLPLDCPVRKARSEGTSADCPLANEQALAVAKLNLQCLAQYEKLRSSSIQDIYQNLDKLFKLRYSTNKLHQFFANLPREMADKGYPLPYKLLVTTNYDNTLERAFRAAEQPFDLVFYVAEGEETKGRFQYKPYEESVRPITSDQEVLSSERPVILKLYGAINNFVITEDHHFNYLVYRKIEQLLPLELLDILWEDKENHHILFLGYSPNDINLRLIINRLWGDRKIDPNSKESWMIHQSKPGALDQKFWNVQGVQLLSSKLKKYLTKLEQTLEKKINEELEQKIKDLKHKKSFSKR